MKKTNAMRLLDQKKLDYIMHEYDASDDMNDGVSVAIKIGKEKELVFKTLVTVGHSKELLVFVIPVDHELDLKKAAKASGEKKIEMLPSRELLAKTGYVKGGCSPLGMKKQLKTFIDRSAEDKELIIFSAGKIGLQIETSPNALRETINVQFEDLTK